MWFRLAALWGCPVREAQARCDSREFAEWCAFYRKDPWGDQRADLRAAELSAMFANVHRKEGAPERSARDFMHFLPPEPETPQPVERQISIARKLKEALDASQKSI